MQFIEGREIVNRGWHRLRVVFYFIFKTGGLKE